MTNISKSCKKCEGLHRHPAIVKLCLCHKKAEEVHKIGEHGAVGIVGQDKDTCVECRQPIERASSPLAQRIEEYIAAFDRFHTEYGKWRIDRNLVKEFLRTSLAQIAEEAREEIPNSLMAIEIIGESKIEAKRVIAQARQEERQRITALVEGIEEFGETYCLRDEKLLNRIKTELLTKIKEKK